MSSIGERLRKERERLGLNQADFGKIARITRESQGNYEGNKRSPKNEYWLTIASIGVDVQYVLTGVYSANLDEVVSHLVQTHGLVASGRQHPHYKLSDALYLIRHMTDRQRAHMQELEHYIKEVEERLEEEVG